MAEKSLTDQPVDKIAAPAAAEAGLHVMDIAGIGLAVLWVLVALIHAWRLPEGAGQGLVWTLLTAFGPVVLIWIAVSTLRTVRALKDEAARLHASVEAMRAAYMASQQGGVGHGLKPSVEKKIEELAQAARQTELALASLMGRAELTPAPTEQKAALVPPPKPASLDEQPALALGTSAEDFRTPLSMADFIKSLDFPENAEDRDGFRALRLALEDRVVARMIRAAQDVLTLLSQEGIYMDDLHPEPARPEIWRRFATGERGKQLSALGGIRDRTSLALTAARMREDPVFRDAGHHFLRTFDKTFAAFEPNASDAEIIDLADTRTARAFMLIGRISGTFD